MTKQYYDVMDPFVTLTAAAAVTTRLKLATSVCLVIQRDTIQTAKLGNLDQGKAEYHGEIVKFPPMMTWPKPVQKQHPPIILGGAFRFAARRAIRYGDRLIPQAPSVGSGNPKEFMPRLRQMAEEAGRDPRSLSVTLGGAPEDLEVLKRNRDLGVARMTVRLPPAKEDEILPILDRWAKLIPQVKT